MNRLLDKYPESIKKELKSQLEKLSYKISSEYIINDKNDNNIDNSQLYDIFLNHFSLNEKIEEQKYCIGVTSKGDGCTRSALYENYCKIHLKKYKNIIKKKEEHIYTYDVIEINNKINNNDNSDKIYIDGTVYNTDGKYLYDENYEKCGYKNDLNEYTICHDPFVLDSINI